ncbi:MAG TPA: hypothetical protein VKC62_06590 [Gaiellaceae bacterium]|nr:hypothetical protein [Gaiellaceae bacterium]
MRVAAVIVPLLGLIGLPIGGAPSKPQVLLVPNVVALGQVSSIQVGGVGGPTLQARLVGASAKGGRPLRWVSLRREHGVWAGSLPAPELRGAYPIELRVRPGAPVMRADDWLLRVFARGTLSRPSFRTPEQVARWWVRTRAEAKLVAMRRWPRPAFDLRDRRLHQLLVLAYSPPGRPGPKDRLGIFITAVRDGYRGNWRLLEATAVP